MSAEFTCEVCKRPIDELEVVGETKARNALHVSSGLRIVPYALRKGEPVEGKPLCFHLLATCWKCWDTAGITANEIMLRRIR